MAVVIVLGRVGDDRAAALADGDEVFGGEYGDGPVCGGRVDVVAGAELFDGG